MTYFGHPLYTLAEVDNAVRAALDSVKREFIAKHCGGAVTSMCARNLTRILDEVRP